MDKLKGNVAPLYAIRERGGKQLYIKVQLNPSKWMKYPKWVWLETHPEALNTYNPETDVFIHLDGDVTNNSYQNIMKVTKGIVGILSLSGGASSDPNITLLKIAQIKLKLATLDAAETLGDVYNAPSKKSRTLKSARENIREKYKERLKNDPVYAEAQREKARKYAKQKRAEMTPEERHAEYLKKKARQKEYYESHKEVVKNAIKKYRSKPEVKKRMAAYHREWCRKKKLQKEQEKL